MTSPDRRTLYDLLALRENELGDTVAVSMVCFSDARTSGVPKSLTWRQLRQRVLALAGRLATLVGPGDRVAIIAPQSLECVVAVLAVLCSQGVAVPLPWPGDEAGDEHCARALADCSAGLVLTDSTHESGLRRWAGRRRLAGLQVLACDRLSGEGTAAPRVTPRPHSPACLLYDVDAEEPARAVVISHHNLVENARQAAHALLGGADKPTAHGVSWLPLHHGMGLVMGLVLPLVAGIPSALVDPQDVAHRPVRWLRTLSQHPDAVAAVPTADLEDCIARVKQSDLDAVDLSRVKALAVMGAPLPWDCVPRFVRAMGRTGLQRRVLCPSFGLREATALVTAQSPGTPAKALCLDRRSLSQHRVREAVEQTSVIRVVSHGVPAGQAVCVAALGGDTQAPKGEVGEILVRGPNVGAGYWNHGTGSGPLETGRVGGQPGVWLRTGWLGFVHANRLFVLGRAQEVVSVAGRHHYPHDLEETVRDSVRWVRRGRLAALWYPAHGSGRLIVVAELPPGLTLDHDARREAMRAARDTVYRRHRIHVSGLHFVPAGALPRTSTGEVSRLRCRQMAGPLVQPEEAAG